MNFGDLLNGDVVMKTFCMLTTVLTVMLAVPAWLHEMYRKRKRERLAPEVEYPATLRARPRFVMGAGVVSTSKEPA